jgi:hypothetical protein
VVQILGQSNKLCSNTQAVVVHSTCGAGGAGCSLQINRKADPIASWAVVANVESIVGIRGPKSLNRKKKKKKKTKKKHFRSKFGKFKYN